MYGFVLFLFSFYSGGVRESMEWTGTAYIRIKVDGLLICTAHLEVPWVLCSTTQTQASVGNGVFTHGVVWLVHLTCWERGSHLRFRFCLFHLDVLLWIWVIDCTRVRYVCDRADSKKENESATISMTNRVSRISKHNLVQALSVMGICCLSLSCLIASCTS